MSIPEKNPDHQPTREFVRDELTSWVLADIESQIAGAEQARKIIRTAYDGGTSTEARINEELREYTEHLKTARGNLTYSDEAPTAKERLEAINKKYIPAYEARNDIDINEDYGYKLLLGERAVLTEAIDRANQTENRLRRIR